MDINFDFTVTGVPTNEIADDICKAISDMFHDKFNTNIHVTYEEV